MIVNTARADEVSVHGAVQADVLVPQTDTKIETKDYDADVLGNGYASVSLFSDHVDAGLRLEYMQYPLPGFEPGFKGWGLGNMYVKLKLGGVELTGGDFYEQFGSGFILRTYEERSLGVDNSLRGGRVRLDCIPGAHITALAGVQRTYWSWSTKSRIYGANADLDIHQYIKALASHNVTWTLGGSWVMRNEHADDKLLPGTNLKLVRPVNTSAFDARTEVNVSGFDVLLEGAWKSVDPSADNHYTYSRGSAYMLSASYSQTGWSAQVQAKRSENMAFRSQSSTSGTSAFINNMPAFAYQHTYALAAMYPYATQAAAGEWALQGNFAYTFKKRTAIGGKYGTKFRLNMSLIHGLDRDGETWAVGTHPELWGTDGQKSKFWGWGPLYYTDINLQMDKKVTPRLHVNAMYMYQRYNQTIIEGEGGMINSNIVVGEVKYKFDQRFTLRGEVQYLQTKQDKGDWLYGLLELSVLPHIMVSVSDQWNVGNDTEKLHYYMVGVTGNYKSNRLMLSYGRTRAGYNCSGGVCRYVPATRGLSISYNYNF